MVIKRRLSRFQTALQIQLGFYSHSFSENESARSWEDGSLFLLFYNILIAHALTPKFPSACCKEFDAVLLKLFSSTQQR